MNKYIEYISLLVFIMLLIINIHIFVSTIQLSENVTHLEHKITALRKQNIELESKLFSVDSYSYASSVASSLDFTKSSTPLYIDSNQYAYNQGL